MPIDSLPVGITAKIHLRLKTDPVRQTKQYKARFVGREFCQVHGVDYRDTYSPVAKYSSILTLLTIGAHRNYEMHQLDYDAAFLNADLKKEVFIKPIGTINPRLSPNHIYKLHKTLYGLKQSPREWWLFRDQANYGANFSLSNQNGSQTNGNGFFGQLERLGRNSQLTLPVRRRSMKNSYLSRTRGQ